MGISDISGRPLPSSSNGGGSNSAAAFASPARTVSVPLIRLTPNEISQELVVSGFKSLPAATAAFTVLTDASTGLDMAQRTQQQSKARIESILIFCPDLIADVAPYLFVQLEIGGQPANAWGNIPVFPRAGAASIDFDTAIYLAPDQPFRILARNTDAANAHFVGVYLRGWFWPKDYIDG